MIEQFISKICEYPEPYIHYAHHAQYDWRHILPWIVEHEVPCEICMRTETDIYEVRLNIGPVQVIMRDSMAFWNSSLKKLAEAFCPEMPKGDLDFDKETFDPDNPVHESYARRDAAILAVALPRLNVRMQKHFGVSIAPTTAGTAVRAWQESLGDDEIYECSKNDDLEHFSREAYYGGLVFLTRNDKIGDGSEVVAETFDINSSYPAQMLKYGVPHGRTMPSRNYMSPKMGIFRVRVRTPENIIVPILPRRNERGAMTWSRGEFETVCTNTELQFAVSHGYEVLEVYEGILWDEVIFPFAAFISKCRDIRFKYRDKPEEMLAKLMQNSLYGKFGSRRVRMRIFHPETDEDYIGAIPLDECEYFWIKQEESDDMKCLPHWAVFITAHARLTLLRNIYAVGPEFVLYGDTDSITVMEGHAEKIDVGLEYGQFKLEKQWTEFRAIAPKVYTGVLGNGKYKGAAKGLPKKSMNDEKWRELLDHSKTSASALSLTSLRVAMAKGAKPATKMTRKSSSLANSANWELHGNNVRPKMAAS